MNPLPLVSVAIPAYNHAVFIEACLASVCEQTYPELELVLIDDGSTDGTFEIARRFVDQHRGRFRRIVLERRKNQGVSANSNACIESCQGEWVHLLGSDDVLCPTKIETIQRFIASWNCSKLALVHADCDFIDESGIGLTRAKLKSRPDAGLEFKAYEWLFLGKSYIFNPTVALHRQTFLTIGGFDRNLPLEDLDCWLRLSERHVFARVPEVLAYYRKHPGNSSRRRVEMLSAQFKTYAKFLTHNPGLLGKDVLGQHYRTNVRRFWRRTWKSTPLAFLIVVVNAIRSYWITPGARDYMRFATLLDRVASR